MLRRDRGQYGMRSGRYFDLGGIFGGIFENEKQNGKHS